MRLLINSISLGNFHFEISLILRDSMLINGILANCDVWVSLTQKHIESLESADISFWKKCLNSHSKTAKELYYLETGTIEIKYIIAKRRLMYLHHILTRPDDELIYKVYNIQRISPSKGDFFCLLQSEREKYGIQFTDEEISSMSKNRFKQIVNTQVRKFAYTSLIQRAMSHSKSTKIAEKSTYKNFKIQSYLKHPEINKEEGQLLFALRSRSLDLKNNLKRLYNNNMICRICLDEDSIESEIHLLSCVVLKGEVDEDEKKIKYADIYGPIDKQIPAVKLYKKILRKRKIYMEVMNI